MVWSAKSTGTEEVECIRSKPLKRRGLSKFYRSKSQSFSSLELVLSSRHGDSAAALGKAAWHCCGSGSLGGAAPGRRSPSPLAGCSEDDDDRQSLNSTVVLRRRRAPPCCRRHVGATRSYERASTCCSLDMEDDHEELSSPAAAAALQHHHTSQQEHFGLPMHSSAAATAAAVPLVAYQHQQQQQHLLVGSSCSLPSQSALAASCSSSTSCGGGYSPCTCTCASSSCSSSSGLLLGTPSSPHLGAHCHLHPLPAGRALYCAANATNAFARSISSDMYGGSGSGCAAPKAPLSPGRLSGSLERDSCSLGSSFTAAGGAWSCPGVHFQTQTQPAAHAQQHPSSCPAPPRHWAGQAADALCAALQMASLGPLQRQTEERRSGAAARARISSST